MRPSKLRALLACLLGSVLVPAACYSGGVVGADCRSGLTECGGECVDLKTDNRNCGACGVVCPSGRACYRGLYCEGFEPGVGGAGGAAGASSESSAGGTGGAVTSGGTGGTGATGGMGAAGEAGAPNVCTEPFNTADHCGACDAACPSGEPFCDCSAGDDACECVAECGDSLTECGTTCADLDRDPLHCGACFSECASGLCDDGSCAGSLPGHVVLMCASFSQARENHPQTTLLGNAVFLSASNRARILVYAEHANPAIPARVDQALGWAAAAQGRRYTSSVANDYTTVAAQLTRRDYDVFLILDQSEAPAGELVAVGEAWRDTLSEFIAGGGTVIVLDGGRGVGEMTSLVNASGLYDLDGDEPLAAGASLFVRAPFDSLAANVLSPFQSLGDACTFVPSQSSDASTVFVVTNASPGSELGAPMVIHRVPGF